MWNGKSSILKHVQPNWMPSLTRKQWRNRLNKSNVFFFLMTKEYEFLRNSNWQSVVNCRNLHWRSWSGANYVFYSQKDRNQRKKNSILFTKKKSFKTILIFHIIENCFNKRWYEIKGIYPQTLRHSASLYSHMLLFS